LEIGEGTTIREGVTIHRGMAKGGISKTVVGANCLLMAYVHIGHDCVVGNNVVMANNASVAGTCGGWRLRQLRGLFRGPAVSQNWCLCPHSRNEFDYQGCSGLYDRCRQSCLGSGAKR
jgi:NDP-sugar pyrophosphorylase family protein